MSNYKYFESKKDYLGWFNSNKYYIKRYDKIGKGILVKYIKYIKENKNDKR